MWTENPTRFCVIMIEVLMPQTTGWDVARLIRSVEARGAPSLSGTRARCAPSRLSPVPRRRSPRPSLGAAPPRPAAQKLREKELGIKQKGIPILAVSLGRTGDETAVDDGSPECVPSRALFLPQLTAPSDPFAVPLPSARAPTSCARASLTATLPPPSGRRREDKISSIQSHCEAAGMDAYCDLNSSMKRLQWELCQLARKECSAKNPPPPGAPAPQARPPPFPPPTASPLAHRPTSLSSASPNPSAAAAATILPSPQGVSHQLNLEDEDDEELEEALQEWKRRYVHQWSFRALFVPFIFARKARPAPEPAPGPAPARGGRR